jgi:hypothetical protein
MKQLPFLLITTLSLFLAGCSEPPSPAPAEKKVEEKPQPITGQSALFKMYQVARAWAPDIAVLKLDSMRVPDVPDQPGKAGAWEATFVSEQRGSARPFTWSAIEELPNLHKDVFAGGEGAYSAGGPDKPFLIGAVKIDTDAALQTAKTKAVDYDKKHPGQPIVFLLENGSKFANPVWRVVWGESVGISSFSILVDATTGTYLETMH